MGDLAEFQSRLDKAKRAIENSGLKEALIIHHDEADGLCSGALTKIAMEKMDLKTRLICLDKLYPEVVKDIESGPRRVIAYSDIGSGHIEWLSTWNRSKNLVLTLDHHDTTEAADPLIHNLNPELSGYSGEKDACSATIAYLFAKTVDPSLVSYAPLAIIGSEEIPGETQGLDLIPVEEGEASHRVIRTSKGGLKLELGESLAPTRASSILNVLGSVGYYRDGPSLGIKACTNGFDRDIMEKGRLFEEERKEANKKVLATIREEGLTEMKNVQWFHAHDIYKGMSGKVVGSFCSYLTYQRFVNPAKYLIGMMNVLPDIPDWGKLPYQMVKVSGRAPQVLAKLIGEDKRPALSKILPDACEKEGGFGDGHSVAASGVLPLGQEALFLDTIDALA